MYRKLILKSFFLVSFVTVFISCDKDFDEVGTNIIGDDHFDFVQYKDASIVAHTQATGVAQSNNLEINPLGIYNNPIFGKTTASFVTQLELSPFSPTFNTVNGVAPAIKSVVLTIPYFSKVDATVTNTDGSKTYLLDSIYGPSKSKIKLGIYESNYYLRSLDPNSELQEQQLYYTNQNSLINNSIVGIRLNDDSVSQNDEFFFDPAEIVETDADGVETKRAPEMSIKLNKAFFNSKILNAPAAGLLNNNEFKNYFRGLYFKVDNSGSDPGQMAMMNFKKGKIKIIYTEQKATTNPTTNVTTYSEIEKVITLSLLGNTISLQEYSDQNANYTNALANPNLIAGDEKLYLKGAGNGSVAVIDIFGNTDVIGYDRKNKIITADPDGNGIAGNGVPDELDYIRSYGWLINEANLTFYLNESDAGFSTSKTANRIYLYDLNNRRPLLDYYTDNSTSVNPKKNKVTHGGYIEKDALGNKKYRIRITNHVRNLVKNDSTNVRFGLAVTESIANVGMNKLLNPVSSVINSTPTSSVLSPLGTILYGNNLPATDKKRLRLEIFYTIPKND